MDLSADLFPLLLPHKHTKAPRTDVETLGQVFTPDTVVRFMLGGCFNRGRVLEPACGDGAFLRYFPHAFGIEIDPKYCPRGQRCEDFFSLPESEKFDTIIGNPPYVRFQDIHAPTKFKLRHQRFDGRSNLYLFFIEKCIEHLSPGGELVFITPRDFLKATSAVRLNQWLHSEGTITHAVELGDSRIFSDAIPNCLIWRFEKGNYSRKTYCATLDSSTPLSGLPSHWNLNWEQYDFVERAGHLLFTSSEHSLKLSEIAFVKVGAVSGADDIYVDSVHGNLEFVCSTTAKSKQTRLMIWCPENPHPALVGHKDRLIRRRIRKFDETNWWQWGRGYYLSRRDRIYVNCKTRNPHPFFVHECIHYDGSVLAIFPDDPEVDVRELCDALNGVDWEELGFVCDGRFLFSQRSLENAPLPESFGKFLPRQAA